MSVMRRSQLVREPRRHVFKPNPNIYIGMVATACRTLLESLDRIPNQDGRTKVAIIAFDVALYFFSIAVSLSFF